jgi:hypothetical protein
MNINKHKLSKNITKHCKKVGHSVTLSSLSRFGGFDSHGRTPKFGWFISWNSLF